jgi:translation initiation factor 3 subunit I
MVIKPLILQGHDRPLTRVRVNRDGDLLFTSGKNSSPCVWYVENGERVGTYEGHQVRRMHSANTLACPQGVVSDLDVSWDSRRLVTAGGGDEHVRLWDVECGVQVSSHHADTNVQSVYWSYSANYIAYTTVSAPVILCTRAHRCYSDATWYERNEQTELRWYNRCACRRTNDRRR